MQRGNRLWWSNINVLRYAWISGPWGIDRIVIHACCWLVGSWSTHLWNVDWRGITAFVSESLSEAAKLQLWKPVDFMVQFLSFLICWQCTVVIHQQMLKQWINYFQNAIFKEETDGTVITEIVKLSSNVIIRSAFLALHSARIKTL